MSSKKITILSLSTALQVALLFMAMILPTAKISMLFIASLLNGIMCAAGYEKKYVFISFGATGILSLLLISNYIIPIGYIIFFGGYGLMHYASIERNFVVKQLIRFAYLVAGLEIIYMAFSSTIFASLLMQPPYVYFLPIVIIGSYIVFQMLYDMVIKEIFKIKSLSKLLMDDIPKHILGGH